MIQLISQAELKVSFPEAFQALPESYQNDSCLEFYHDCNGNLCSAPKEDQVPFLGVWESVYLSDKQMWV